ncbi:MAG: trehalose-6-phosphate synthase, partial [Flavisolibacter sp.]
MSRLIIISNRLPFSIEKEGEDLQVRQSSGGLVSAIKSYFEKTGGDTAYSERIWAGSMDASKEDWEAARKAGEWPPDFSILPIFPDKNVYANYYNGFSNSTVWPLFHYFPSLVEFKKEYFEDYRKINQLFADTIVAMYQPGDVIWVH